MNFTSYDDYFTPYPLTPRQKTINKIYGKPYTDGVFNSGLRTEQSTDEVTKFSHELAIGKHSGSNLGASHSDAVAKRLRLESYRNTKEMLEALSLLYSLHKYESRYLYLYEILVTDENLKLSFNEDREEYWFTNSNNDDVAKNYSKARETISRTLQNQKGKVKKSVIGRPFNNFGLDSGLESLLDVDSGCPTLNMHMHMLLVIDEPVNIDDFETKILSKIQRFGIDNVMIEPLEKNYGKPSASPAIVDFNQQLTEQKDTIKALQSFDKYLAKQVNFADPFKRNKLTGMSQENVLNSFDESTRQKAVVALYNTMHWSNNVRTKSKSGLLKSSKITELNNRALIAKILASKDKHIAIDFEFYYQFESNQCSYCPFNLNRFKPPP